MTDLREPLSRLGLAQYIEKFKEEGFETWETLLDITESDLYWPTHLIGLHPANSLRSDALGVKLGHRRVSHTLTYCYATVLFLEQGAWN